VRKAVVLTLLAGLVVGAPRNAPAACSEGTPCVDAEPLWLTPSPRYFAVISDVGSPSAAALAGGFSVGFRWQPAVLVVPAPNAEGREVNAIRHATDLSLGLRVGIGNRMELTAVLPAGLYQAGAGIKGVTHQSAPPIAAQSLHDPRIGFGYALPKRSAHFGVKLRFELKLPLGSQQQLSGETSFVASPSVAAHFKTSKSTPHGLFGAAELGARLRRPTDFYASRIGSQALIAVGAGYALRRPRLIFALEAYALPSLVAGGPTRHLPAEWLASTSYLLDPNVALGLSGGSGLPLSDAGSGSVLGFGVPAFRGLLFLRLAPSPE
jgi:hypothetical protein